MKAWGFAVAALLISVPASHADEAKTLEDVTACVERSLPTPDGIRAVRIVARDRAGSDRVTVVRVHHRRADDGRRQILLRVVEPKELRGTSFLILERDGENEIYFKSTELPEVKRIRTSGRSARLFGSDFSYEDFEYFQALGPPGESNRMEDTKIGERPVYLVETRPPEAAESAYERILTFVDKKTCIPLRMEFYEAGDRLRKEIIVNPHQILQRGSAWIAHMAVIRDVREFTTTQFLVDSTEHEGVLPADMFSVEGLTRAAN
jgi:hypothetical protein